ncbi:MAG: hcrA [Paucimonas sp.]|nr:hcrA [Paucimonas sp.]
MSKSLIGASLPQVNAREKVLGAAKYVGDMKIAGMLEAKVLRSPHPHARIVRIDTSRAKRLPGVKAVVTGADTPEQLFGFLHKEYTIFAKDRVRYAGEEVAAVAAVDEATALDALELIHVEYEILPAVFDPEIALMPGAPEVHAGTGNLAREINICRGNVEEGFQRSAAIYEATYDMGYQYHAYMEPMCTLAQVEPDGRLTVWAPTQSIFFTRQILAEALGVAQTMIRVIQTVTGGGFGGKLTEDMNSPICAFLALQTGRPVRLQNNRLEDFLAARSSMPARVTLKMGLSKDGEILAKDAIVVADNGAFNNLTLEQVLVTAFRSDSLHRLSNVRCHARLAYTNKTPSGTFRAFGTQQMVFPVDAHLTMLAEMIGMDPVDVHLRNAIRKGETSVHGWYMGSCGLIECLEKSRDAIGWDGKHGAPKGEGVKRRGVGIGSGIHVTANRQIADWDGSTVFVKVNFDGRVILTTGESDLGQGSNTVLAQICAETLGIPIDHVRVNMPDTDTAPLSFGTVASRVTILAGNATIRAATEARNILLDAAAAAAKVEPADLTIRDGVVEKLSDGSKVFTLAEVAKIAMFRVGGEGVFTKATYDPPTTMADKETYYGNVAPAYSFAAATVEVEVDIQTGQVALLDCFVADDCGRALNPLWVEGQVRGAAVQGIGWALYEQFQYEDGRLINGNFADYTIATADAVPPLRTALVESMEPNGPFGAKGASETAIVPIAGAIANAVYDAVGVRINSLPITPEKVLAGLREKAAMDQEREKSLEKERPHA